MSLKLKITLVTSLVFLLVMILLGYIFFVNMSATMQKEVESEALQICDEAAYTIDKNIYSDTYILRTVMTRSDIASYGYSIDDKIKSIQEVIRLFQYEYIVFIWDGEYYKVYNDFYVTHKPEADIAILGMQETIFYGWLYEREKPGLFITEPVRKNADGTRYQIVFKRKADWIWTDLMASDSLMNQNIIVSTLEGQVLFPAEFETMTTMPPLSMPNSLMSRVLLNGPEDKQDYYAYSISLQDAPLNVTSYVDQQDVVNGLHGYVMNFILLVGCSLFLIAGIIYLLVRHMTKAITGLARYAEKTDRPDNVPAVFVSRKDEAGTLAREFSSLMHRLQNAMDEKDYVAFHDKLTELPNRYVMEQDFTELLLGDRPFAFALLDVDNFKTVNDRMGHLQGDLILYQFAALLQRCNRGRLKAYRWGGDEFGIVLYGTTREDYERTLDDMLKETEIAFKVLKPVKISASIGVCMCPECADTQQLLLQHADHALMRAKQRGKNCYCFFNDPDDAEIVGIN